MVPIAKLTLVLVGRLLSNRLPLAALPGVHCVGLCRLALPRRLGGREKVRTRFPLTENTLHPCSLRFLANLQV